ncbi:MAG: hypothetical protein WD830_05005, partial [Chloroflexota bacterium]
ERAAIGFAVAVVLRSQLAGAVVGIVLFLGESIVKFTLVGLTAASNALGGFTGGGFEATGPEWYQFLPVSIGDYVVGAAPGASLGLGGGFEQFILKPVPLEIALPTVLIYTVVSIVVAVFALNRQEIT